MPGAATGGGFRGGTSATARMTEAEAASAESRVGGTMGPMVGGSGEKEGERTRRTWLSEDRDLWEGDTESSPEVIGALESSAHGKDEEPETGILSAEELDSDDEELAALLAELDDTDPEPSGDEPADVSAQITELKEKLARLERQQEAERGLPSPVVETGSERDWLGGDDI